jgi:hypothetical protein
MARWVHLPSHKARAITHYYDFSLLLICGSGHIFILGVQKAVTIRGEQLEADFAAILHRARDTISCTVDQLESANQTIFESNRNHISLSIRGPNCSYGVEP